MLRLVVECDGCGAIVWADDTGVVARSARTVAKARGWSQEPGDDRCPTCLHQAQFSHAAVVGR